MLPIVAFRIWYADGSTYYGTTKTKWRNAPKENVQVVTVYHGPPYKTLIAGQDIYSHPDWPGELPKNGSLIADADFEAIYAKAHNEAY